MTLGKRLLMENLQTKLMTRSLRKTCRRRAASQGHPGRGRKEAMVLGPLRVLCGDEDSRTVETSSKVTVSGVDEDPYAPSQVSMISSPEEAGKRRRKASKSRLAKKAPKTRRRRRSPPQSVAPRDEVDEEEDDGLDPELFQGLRGVIPEQDAQELLVEVTGLARGFKAQSVSAKSRASRMETLMLQMGREAAAMREEAEEDKRLMRAENSLLKRTLGLVTHASASARKGGNEVSRTGIR